MPSFFEYHPHNGVTEYFDYDESTGVASIHSTKDIEPFLAMTQEARNTGACDKGLMDNGREFHFYASLDPIVQLELRQKGIDIYSKDPAMIRRMFREINQNYAKCRMSTKIHNG